MKVALDSNILVYLAGGERVPGDRTKIVAAREIVEHLLAIATVVVPVQAIGEATRVLREKYRRSHSEVGAAFEGWAGIYDFAPTTADHVARGLDLVQTHRLQHWDAIITAVASDADCLILLSEDMQHGFIWRGLTIVNPFAVPQHHLLASLLEP